MSNEHVRQCEANGGVDPNDIDIDSGAPRANHTPGPWEVVPATVEFLAMPRPQTIRAKCWGKSDQMGDYQGVIICDFEEAHGNRPHAFAECEANARLIAASPDLLAQLKAAHSILIQFIQYQGSKHCLEIEAAITKATGQN